ncbi:MAG: tRNA-(ms[2]io[6]A)-hydroxylase [Gammaproteobacteria bacterium]
MSAIPAEAIGASATVDEFLAVATPQTWVDWALQNEAALLWDHGNCEKKAASTALQLLYRYPQNEALVYRLSRLAREELRHFEQVQKLIKQRGHEFVLVLAAKYAARLFKHVRSYEPQRLIDQLVIGAFIEARSCERFGRIAPHLDEPLRKFYLGLMESEARHFTEYLNLARPLCSEHELNERVAFFRQLEADIIVDPVEAFAFHSGPPITR